MIRRVYQEKTHEISIRPNFYGILLQGTVHNGLRGSCSGTVCFKVRTNFLIVNQFQFEFVWPLGNGGKIRELTQLKLVVNHIEMSSTDFTVVNKYNTGHPCRLMNV